MTGIVPTGAALGARYGDGGNRTHGGIPLETLSGRATETRIMQGEIGAAPRERPAPDTTEVAVMQADPIPVPLRDFTGTTIAFAVLDVADAHLAEERWYLDSDPTRRNGKMYARRNGEHGGRRVPIYLHREVLGLERGDRRQVDHENGLTLDCRRANLRFAANAENGQNRVNRKANASSRYRGVTWDKSREKWLASGTVNGKRKTLGRFDSEDEAGRVAADFRREHMPFSEEAAA